MSEHQKDLGTPVGRGSANDETIVVPADLYDALEFAALAFGGIGAGKYFDDQDRPVCLIGYARAVDGGQYQCADQLRYAFYRALGNSGVGHHSDDAVAGINDERGRRWDRRVPFAEVCRRLNIVRGD